MNIVEATRSYEAWLARHLTIVPADIRLKHERMREDPFTFLRATFYWWIQALPSARRREPRPPAVLSIGDVHLENFGTWRDAEARLNWGVNDFDEAARLPYTQDLIRLATSAVLAGHERHLTLSRTAICEAILAGYGSALAGDETPVVLAERRLWLRHVALDGPEDPRVFWEHIETCRAKSGGPARLLRSTLPENSRTLRTVHRVAGAGSLGRQRFVLIAECGGSKVAREAKAMAPSAAAWAGLVSSRGLGHVLLARAIRVPDPFLTIGRNWTLRRLAPDCKKIELADFPRVRDERRLLRTMGLEVANVQRASSFAAVRRHFHRAPDGWLERAATAMAARVIDEWKMWRRRG